MSAFSFTIEGDPSGARVNAARRAGVTATGKPYSYTAKKAVQWSTVARMYARTAWARTGRATITGPVALTIEIYWPRLRRKATGAGLPLGDVDACLKAVIDVLDHKRVAILEDDCLVTMLGVVNCYDPKRPRIEVTVTERVDPELERCTPAEVEPA